ncbi:MAG: hypothetical protein ACD_73C00801G0004 [uncultured bacterium]|nr:MAG: hypothetical protein ACD_73C00801G0004 [uncultured bacterium]
MKRNLFIIITLLAQITIMNCGGGASGSSSSSSSLDSGTEYSGSNLEGGNITQLNFNASNQASVNLGTVDDNAEYILEIYSYNTDGDTIAYQLGNSDENSAPPAKALTQDATEDFHEMLRDAENDLDPNAIIDSEKVSKALTKAATIGSERSFKVLNSFSGGSSYTTVTATLRYETSHFKAYVDTRNASSMSDSEIATLCENFDSVIDKEHEMFGTESDIDDDGTFNILFTQAVNELGGSAGGIITGFFYAVDLFDTSVYSQSNETEVFYTFVPDPDGDNGVAISKEFALSNILPSVLPHEFQHMINFNSHYFVNDGSPEYSFLNEGLSHLAEDIYSLNSNDYMTTTGIENPARVAGYLDSIDSLCVTCGASLYQRGGSYLLLRYLYEQAQKGNLSGAATGMELLQRLLDTDKTGVENIVSAAYDTSDVTTAFTDLMGQFGLAILVSDTGLIDDDRLTFDGIDLRAVQDDNRGTELQGPAITSLSDFPMSETVAGAAMSFVRLTGSQINAQGGTIDINLTSGYSGGGYLIQTGL